MALSPKPSEKFINQLALQFMPNKLEMRYESERLPVAKAADMWPVYFSDMSPADLYDKLAGPKHDIAVTIQTYPNYDYFDINVSLDGVLHDKRPPKEVNTLKVRINHNGPSSFDYTHLTPQNQGKHMIAGSLRRLVDVAKTLGVSSLDTKAYDLGSYAWLQYGFCPDTSERWDDFKKKLHEKIHEEKESYVTDWGDTLLPGEKIIIDKVLNSDLADLPTVLPTLTHLDRRLDSSGERPLTVGKALLFNMPWQGSLSLQDGHPSYERFKAYTGKALEKMQAVV